ncbi:3-keto-5-aminohexanoate cleavage protein [Nakamurella antarctica]|nr:3-keto-5-aminohexanoate cleavage protein [Nakamurella antarctica]
MLLRVALDAQQIGVTRFELSWQQTDLAQAVEMLRAETQVILTAPGTSPLASMVDLVWRDRSVTADLPGMAPKEFCPPGSNRVHLLEFHLHATDVLGEIPSQVGLIAAGSQLPISVSSDGPTAMLAMMAALSGGCHLRVGTADSGGGPRENVALAAKAVGFAKLGGRPPLTSAEARVQLGLAPGKIDA